MSFSQQIDCSSFSHAKYWEGGRPGWTCGRNLERIRLPPHWLRRQTCRLTNFMWEHTRADYLGDRPQSRVRLREQKGTSGQTDESGYDTKHISQISTPSSEERSDGFCFSELRLAVGFAATCLQHEDAALCQDKDGKTCKFSPAFPLKCWSNN